MVLNYSMSVWSVFFCLLFWSFCIIRFIKIIICIGYCTDIYIFFITDSSLNDIKYVLNPIFDEEQITQMDSDTKMSRATDGTMYMPGIVGLNNIKANDYCNVILQVGRLGYMPH